MNIIIVAGFCAAIFLAYFVLLMADAKKLQQRLLMRQIESIGVGQREFAPVRETDLTTDP